MRLIKMMTRRELVSWLGSAVILMMGAVTLSAAAPRLLVMPLDQANEDESFAPLGEGIGPELAERLEWAGADRVTDAVLERTLEDAGLEEPEALSLASQRRLAGLAGADYFISGAVAGDGESARISLRLLHGREPAVLARIEEKIGWSDLPAFLSRATQTLAVRIGLAPGADEAIGPGALELYLRASGNLSAAARLPFLQTCVEQAPAFLRARLRLAETLLDAQPPRAATRAAAAFEPLVGRAGLARPDGSTLAARLAHLQARIEFALGHTTSAEQWTRLALAARPGPEGWYLLARIRFAIGDYQAAIQACDAALAIDAQHAAARKLRERAVAMRPQPAEGEQPPMLSPQPPPLLSPAPKSGGEPGVTEPN